MKKIIIFLSLVICITLSGCTLTNTLTSGDKKGKTSEEFLSISGGIDSSNKMYISFLAPLDYELYNSPESQEYYNNKKPYTLELINKENSLIDKYKFGTNEMHVSTVTGDRYSDSGMFSLSVSYGSSVNKIIIKKGEDILFEKVRSPHSPVVKINNPQDNSKSSGEVNVSWIGSDEDGDDLLYRLETSVDNGQKNWNPYLAFNKILSKKIKIESGKNIIRVLSTDGLNTSYDYVNITVNNPLEVKYHTPYDKQMDASTINYLDITFNNELKKESVNSNSFKILENGTTLYKHGGLEFNIKKRIRCYIGHNESAPLKNNTSYTVILTTEIEDISGNHLDEDYKFTFTTRK